MDFTYDDYFNHIRLLKENGYSVISYGEEVEKKAAILRHDVDFSLRKAAEFANMEQNSGLGIRSTYFVLLRSNFYNTMSVESQRLIQEILSCGHEVGLHFDETCYEVNGDYNILADAVMKEKYLLEQVTGKPVRAISMHRPSKLTLDGDYKFEGLINSYSQVYFRKWKYVSDSRMHWREDLRQVIGCGEYDKLHILTHPFWYAEKAETIKYKLTCFINNASLERYDNIHENLRDLEDVICKGDINDAIRYNSSNDRSGSAGSTRNNILL